MTRTAQIISDSVIASLRAQGLLVVRASNAQMIDPEAFARDIAANAAMALYADDSGHADYDHHWRIDDAKQWRPGDATDEALRTLRESGLL